MSPEEEETHFKESVLAYKYTSPNLSLFERLFLNEFWEKVVYVYPVWLAPNLITLSGGSCLMIAYALSAYFSADCLGEGLPKEFYALAGVLLFMYQTLDGSDGKQARRTGSGSALGELMDHGVDAVVTGFGTVLMADAMGFGLSSPVPWICVFGGQMGFFLSNLTLLHRGKQVFNMFDVIELQCVMIACLLFTGVVGTEWWKEAVVAVPVPALHQVIDFVNDHVFYLPTDAGYIQPRFFIAVGALLGVVQNTVLYIGMCLSPYLKAMDKRPAHIQAHAKGTGVLALLHQLTVIVAYAGMGAGAVTRAWGVEEENKAFTLRCLVVVACFAFGVSCVDDWCALFD